MVAGLRVHFRAMDRRRNERHFACFPIHLHRENEREHMALIRELSITGAQVLTRISPEVGSTLSLTLYLESPEHGTEVQARVIRSAEHTEEGLWTRLVAVEFAEPLQGLDAQIKELSERQKRAGL